MIKSNKIIRSFSLMSGMTLITVVFGILTMKVVAVFGGIEVVGILEIYKRILGLIVPVISAGTGVVLVREMSKARSDSRISKILSGYFSVFIVQTIAVLLLIFYANNFTLLIFGERYELDDGTMQIRVVILMSFIVLISQTFIALINGKINLKRISVINILTATTTLIASYPLLMIGDIGVALLTGFGSVVGSVVGLFFVVKIYKKSLRNIDFKFGSFYKSSVTSIWLTLHPMMVSLLFFLIPIIVNNNYGMESLGLYSSIVAISSILTMVLMSAMKTYFLPSLGLIKTTEEKIKYIERITLFLLVTLFPLILIVMFFSENILLILFSSDFVAASKLLELQIMSVLLSAFIWPYAYFLLHNGKERLYFLIDFIWVASIIWLLWIFVDIDAQLDVVPQVFLVGSLISTILYLSVILIKYGSEYISLRNIFLSIVFIIALVASYFSIKYLPMGYKWSFFTLVFIGYFLFLYKQPLIKQSLI